MRYKSSMNFIIENKSDVYPITLIKFLLNKRKILAYFNNVTRKNFRIKFKQTLSPNNCNICKQFDDDKLCRNHSSIKRVMNADNVLFETSTHIYFYKNEIFKMIDNKLVIIYCPHPKMIPGNIDDEKVRKINPLIVVDPLLTDLPAYKNIHNFNYEEIINDNLKCWFNDNFSIVTIPNNIENHDWCLIPNNKQGD